MYKFVLFVLMFVGMDAYGTQREAEAARMAAEAALKQSGVDKMIENKVREYITKDVEKVLGKVLGPVKIVVDKRVELKWEF